jgi:hypothetical protein
LFFGFLAVAVAVGIALFLWTPEAPNGYDLTPEELRVLSGEESPQTNEPAARTPSSDAAGTSSAASGNAVLQVDTTPSGATVAVDGKVAGVTPLRRERLPARWHVISIESPDFAAKDTLVYLEADRITRISLRLAPSAAARPAVPSPVFPPRSTEAPARATAPASAPMDTPPVVSSPSAPASGAISVVVNPSGVPVQLDGETVGVAPMELSDVTPGVHTLTFFLPGYETATVEVNVEPGAREVVDVALVPQTGTLAVVARPWGSIYVNGTLRAEDTDVSVEVMLPLGTHHVRVEHPALGSQERTVEVRPDRTISEVFDLN